jgi:murein DD-endopeptidase MepM/ murein hydrolase activator NlpD
VTPGPSVVVAVLLMLVAACGADSRTAAPQADGEPSSRAVGRAPVAGAAADARVLRESAGRLRYAFPVRGRTSYSRAHHDYPATDVFATCGTPTAAPVRGVVLEISRVDRYDPARDRPALRGGRFWSMRGADGVRYYGSHLRSLSSTTRPGARVRAGAMLGRVGQSGNARGTGCHLHFGISPVCAGTGDWWVRRGTVRPYRFLQAWERDRHLSPARAVRRWRATHSCRR